MFRDAPLCSLAVNSAAQKQVDDDVGIVAPVEFRVATVPTGDHLEPPVLDVQELRESGPGRCDLVDFGLDVNGEPTDGGTDSDSRP